MGILRRAYKSLLVETASDENRMSSERDMEKFIAAPELLPDKLSYLFRLYPRMSPSLGFQHCKQYFWCTTNLWMKFWSL